MQELEKLRKEKDEYKLTIQLLEQEKLSMSMEMNFEMKEQIEQLKTETLQKNESIEKYEK